MKRLFSIVALLAVALFVAGCEEKPAPEVNNYKLQLTSKAQMEFDEEGGVGQITYTLAEVDDAATRLSPAPVLPTAVCEAEWVTITNIDNGVIDFEVAAQSVEERRQTVIFVSYGDQNFSVGIHQGLDASDFEVVFNAEYLCGTYNGRMNTLGYNYFIILSDMKAPTASNHYYGCKQYRLDLFSDVTSGFDYTECAIPAGTYTFDGRSTGAPGTLRSSGSKYVEVSATGAIIETSIIDAKIIIKEGSIDARIRLQDGKWHRVTYSGELVTGGYDMPPIERPYSRMTEDFNFTHDTGFLHAYYRGDYYGLGCDVWYVDMCQTVMPMNGTYFMLMLMVDRAKGGYKEDAFLGEYTVAPADGTGADLYNTYVAGELHDGHPTNSWCGRCEKSQIINTWGGPLMGGKITIERDGDMYLVKYDCVDDNGYKIVGTFRCGMDGYINQDCENPDADLQPAD